MTAERILKQHIGDLHFELAQATARAEALARENEELKALLGEGDGDEGEGDEGGATRT